VGLFIAIRRSFYSHWWVFIRPFAGVCLVIRVSLGSYYISLHLFTSLYISLHLFTIMTVELQGDVLREPTSVVCVSLLTCADAARPYESCDVM